MKGVDSMEVKADKNINIGDEITVSYGDNYFGPDNVECLCHTCEVLERNGWTSKAAFAEIQSGTSTPVAEVRSFNNAFGKKRKREDSSTSSQLGRSLKKIKALASPSKLQYSWTPPSTSESEIAAEEDRMVVDQQNAPPSSSAKSSSQTVTPKRDGRGRFLSSASKANAEIVSEGILEERSKSFPLSPSTTSPSSQDSETSDAVGRAQVPMTIKVEAVEKTVVESDVPMILAPEDMIAIQSQQPSPEQSVYDIPDTPENADEASSDTEICYSNLQAVSTLTMTKVSTIASIEPEPDQAVPITPDVIPSIEPVLTTIKTITKAKITVTPLSDTIRVPGDYILTRKLLAQPHDRWVRCHNDICHTFFLQPNGYQTRRECPRCERHSMLYGFPWPKTDPDPRKLLSREVEKSNRGRPKNPAPTPIIPAEEPARRRLKSEIDPKSKYSAYRRQGRCGKGSWVEGGGDDEERVMDHRTIHRFVLPEDERELTRKGLLLDAEKARAMGDGELEALAALDGRRARFRDEARGGSGEGRESTGLYGSGTDREDSDSPWDDVDAEGRRRSNRIVESRVYVNVNMRR